MKKIVYSLGLLSALISGHTLANWEVGAAYHQLSENVTTFGGIEVGPEVKMLSVSVAYDFEVGNDLFVVPEITVGQGTSEDNQRFSDFPFEGGNFTANVDSISSDVDLFLQIGVRLEHRFDTGVYAFVVPSYANVETTSILQFGNVVVVDIGAVDAPAPSVTEEDEWHFGLGLGFGYNFDEHISAEVSYQNFDDVETLSIGARYAF